MKNVIGGLILTILCFVTCILGTTVIASKSQQDYSESVVEKELQTFVDKVTDSGQINNAMLNDFYLGLAESSLPCNVKIQKYVKIVNPVPGGGTETRYMLSSEIDDVPEGTVVEFNKGDFVKVQVYATGQSIHQSMLRTILRLNSTKFKTSLSGRVRN